MPFSETERNLNRLEAELKRLEAEYNMYFAGRLPKPPWDTRNRVAAMVRQYDRLHIQNYGDRFRFSSLQSRFAAFVELWDRGLKAREEGRPGPFGQAKTDQAERPKPPDDRVLYVAAFQNPMNEIDKLQELYQSLVAARREVGGEPVPFEKFAELVKTQVDRLQAGGSPEVAFRVALKDGRVNFTAKALSAEVDAEEE